ncbi:MAG TPA: hypothetical protein VKB51_00705 [bacterium]|nr:hypothetical protein [bacterium]
MKRLMSIPLLLVLIAGSALAADKPLIPPIKADIVDPQKQPLGRAMIYPNYVELEDAKGALRGAIGVVMTQGRAQLFLVRHNEERRFIGWAENHRLYNTEDQLVGFYFWTPIWSYVYDPKMKKLGQAQCIAYQGVCAAGIAGYLLGLL